MTAEDARTDSGYSGDGIVLENGSVRLVVLPNAGGRIDDVLDLATGKHWLWHPAGGRRSTPRAQPVSDQSFDDRWQGGWDDIFPGDAAGSFFGLEYFDHGELWRKPWRVMEHHARGLILALECQGVPVRVEKEVRLAEEGRAFHIRHRFENRGGRDIPYLFKHHPALSIEPGDEFIMPACTAEPVDPGFSRLIGSGAAFAFPQGPGAAGAPVRLDRALPDDGRSREFLYLRDLEAGYCGLRNAATASELRLHFELTDFPYVWLFQSYGGFRGHYVAMLEPATTLPYDLERALRQGTCAVLGAGKTRSYELGVEIRSTRQLP